MVRQFLLGFIIARQKAENVLRLPEYRGIDSFRFQNNFHFSSEHTNIVGLFNRIPNNDECDYNELLTVFCALVGDQERNLLFKRYGFELEEVGYCDMITDKFNFNGYDCVDLNGLFSAICIFMEGRIQSFPLEEHLNDKGLFDSCDDANVFARHASVAVPSHAPFSVVGVFEMRRFSEHDSANTSGSAT